MPKVLTRDYDDLTTTSTSSFLEFLAKEQECSDAEADRIFQEVGRLAGGDSNRSDDDIDELIREAEVLLNMGSGDVDIHFDNKRRETKQNKFTTSCTTTPKMQCTPALNDTPLFACFVENLPTESVISEESTPNDMQDITLAAYTDDATTIEAKLNDETDETDDGTDTMEEITECMETIEISVEEDIQNLNESNNTTTTTSSNDGFNDVSKRNEKTAPSQTYSERKQLTKLNDSMSASMTALVGTPTLNGTSAARRPSCETVSMQHSFYTAQIMPSPSLRSLTPLNFNPIQACSPSTSQELHYRSSAGARRASMTNTPDSGHFSQAATTPRPNSPPPLASSSLQHRKNRNDVCDKSVNSSPKHFTSTLTSPIRHPTTSMSLREHNLKQEIEQLQEKLKDTEERLQSLRIQHDSLSQLHRDLRENNTRLQEETEMLQLDVQHLNECANILRSELQTARNDRKEALELQKVLQTELEEARHEKKRTQEKKDADAKTIQDLQRQCREMERILMRKHPDSVSALIVASKMPGAGRDQDNMSSRKLLEQRIAQLEADAKEQDKKAQQILANVQARFNSVQAKYETHIADLETQVLSLQEINTKLNEKIESQVRTLNYFVTKRAENYYNNSTQTDDEVKMPRSSDGREGNGSKETAVKSTCSTQTIKATRDHSTNTIGGATAGGSQTHSAGSSASSTANSTPINSRPNSKQSGLRKPVASSNTSLAAALTSKLPVSQSDSTISLSAHHAAAREDAHLLATIRGMRADLAVKDKAMQRLTRELDECKKTVRKLEKEKDALKSNNNYGIGPSSSTTSLRRNQDGYTPANTESQALREAQNKLKLMEADYKSLHEKRLQDLKALQTAHESELASCTETVRILQQRLNERSSDEANGVSKRRKLPVDYYALKAKVSSLERRHTEREERLHLLVEALSKGRLNGALEDLLRDNNNK